MVTGVPDIKIITNAIMYVKQIERFCKNSRVSKRTPFNNYHAVICSKAYISFALSAVTFIFVSVTEGTIKSSLPAL